MIIVELNFENRNSYLKGISDIHYGSYSKLHFTSCFSQEKLEVYYSHLIDASDLSFVAIEDNCVAGFVISGENVSSGVAKFVSREKLYLFFVILRNPKFILKKALSYIYAIKDSARNSTFLVPYRLMSIAVKSGVQSRGVGGGLLKFLEARLLEAGVLRYGLSVKKNNNRAVDFYFRSGFVVHRESSDALYFYKELKNE